MRRRQDGSPLGLRARIAGALTVGLLLATGPFAAAAPASLNFGGGSLGSLGSSDGDGGTTPEDPTTTVTTVTDTGFSVDLGPVEVSGPPGVAPPGTQVAVALTNDTLEPAQADLARVIAAPVRIRLNDGAMQPDEPITVRFDLSGLPVGSIGGDDRWSVPQLLSRHEGADSATWIDSQWDSTTKTLTAQLPGLSTQFIANWNWQQLGSWVDQKVGELRGTRFAKPDCALRPFDNGNTTYLLSNVNSPAVGMIPGTDDVVWPCLERSPEGLTRLTLHSNTNIVWTAQTEPSITGAIDTEFSSVTDVFNLLAGSLVQGLGSASDTLVLTGGSSHFDAAAPPSKVVLRPNAGLTTFQILTIATGIITDRFTAGMPLDWVKPVGECLRAAMDLGELNLADVDDVITAVPKLAGCMEVYADQMGKLSEKKSNLLAAAHNLIAMTSQLEAQIRGLVATIAEPATLAISKSGPVDPTAVGLEIEATASPSTPATFKAGQPITFYFKITNTSGGRQQMDVRPVVKTFSGSDPMPTMECPSVGPLSPKASVTCVAIYTITEADVAAGQLRLIATALGDLHACVPEPEKNKVCTITSDESAVILSR
ncbi:hypothetical protein Br6_04823 [Rhodococcus sp. Br-6]|nr:hypothetical protein Br6_04823 [Rhodococcus sp. Br-6]